MNAILLFLLVSCATVSFGQMKSYKLPKTWDKDFVVSGKSTDHKRGGTVSVRLTYDSCIYTSSTTNDPNLKNKTFALTEADRDTVLAKLRELEIEKLKSPTPAVQIVDYTIILCMGDTCIDGGQASTLNEKDQAIFFSAYRFVNDFAIKK